MGGESLGSHYAMWRHQIFNMMINAKLSRLDLTLLVALNVDSGNLVVKLSTADSVVIPPIETEVLVFKFNFFFAVHCCLGFSMPGIDGCSLLPGVKCTPTS